jgi:hypothetical protein
VLCCFSDTGPVRGARASLAGVRETFTKADFEQSEIGDGLLVADHVR